MNSKPNVYKQRHQINVLYGCIRISIAIKTEYLLTYTQYFRYFQDLHFFTGPQRRSRRDVPFCVPPSIGEDFPHEDPIEKGLHAQGELRDDTGQDRGDAGQGRKKYSPNN